MIGNLGRYIQGIAVCCFQVEFEFRNVGFCRGKETGQHGKKPSTQGEHHQKTQPRYGVNSGI